MEAGAHMPRDMRHEQRRGIHFLRVQNLDIGGVLLRIVFKISHLREKAVEGRGREGDGAQRSEALRTQPRDTMNSGIMPLLKDLIFPKNNVRPPGSRCAHVFIRSENS